MYLAPDLDKSLTMKSNNLRRLPVAHAKTQAALHPSLFASVTISYYLAAIQYHIPKHEMGYHVILGQQDIPKLKYRMIP